MKEAGQTWLDRLQDLINLTNTDCMRIKQIALDMNDEQAQLYQTIHLLTARCRAKEFDWVVATIIQFKNNIDISQEQLNKGNIEKGFEELTGFFIQW